MRRMGATAMISEFDMGAGQVPKEGRRGIPSLFSAASKDIYQFGQAAASVGIVDQKEGYID
jgi:hypothetical protein